MLDGDCAKPLVGALEFLHDISGQGKQRYEDKNDAALLHTERPSDVHLTGTRSLNYSKMIGNHGMKKTIDSIELRRKNILDTPNQRRGSDDARFQPIVIAPGHGDDPRCVCCRPIVKPAVREMGEGVVVISL